MLSCAIFCFIEILNKNYILIIKEDVMISERRKREYMRKYIIDWIEKY